jgi:hypothetical protein
MLFVRRTRPLAWPLSLAMAATFPGVFLFQLVAAPFAFGIILIAWLFGLALVPIQTVVALLSFSAVVAAFLVMLAMSLAGFYEGWRVGWSFAKGQRLREIAKQGPTARLIRSIRRRLRPRTAENE